MPSGERPARERCVVALLELPAEACREQIEDLTRPAIKIAVTDHQPDAEKHEERTHDVTQRPAFAVDALLLFLFRSHRFRHFRPSTAEPIDQQWLRELDLAKPPGVAETIDWARTLDFLGETDLTEDAADVTLGSVIKERDDLDFVRENLTEITSGA